MNTQEIIKTIETNESIGLSKKDIADFEKEINWNFPTDYREILKAVDGGYGKIGNFYIDFWNLNDIIFYYEDIEELDGLIPFASDGCGIAFAFDKKSEEIVSIPMDCLERNYAKIIAVNYDDFIDRLCLHKLQYQEHYGPEQRQNYAIKKNDVLIINFDFQNCMAQISVINSPYIPYQFVYFEAVDIEVSDLEEITPIYSFHDDDTMQKDDVISALGEVLLFCLNYKVFILNSNC